MTNKTVSPDRPYVYAFSPTRLVLLVCIVIVLVILSFMLGIRTEKYQQSKKVADSGSVPQTPAQSSSVPEAASPEAGSGAETSGAAAEQTGSRAKASPAKPAPARAAEPAQPRKTAPKKPAPPPEKREISKGHYAIQVSSSRKKSMAGSRVEILGKKGFDSYLEVIDLGDKGRFFRVMVGPFRTKAEAKKALGRLADDSRFTDSFIRYMP